MRVAVVIAALLVCAATSPPRFPRNFPRWGMTEDGDQRVGCAVATVWVSKSGKTGVGVSALVRADRADRAGLAGGQAAPAIAEPPAANEPVRSPDGAGPSDGVRPPDDADTPAIATSPDDAAAAPAIATAAEAPGCRFEVIDARLVLADGAAVTALRASVATDGAPRDVSGNAVVVAPGGQARVYLPFAFDNNAMWNRGVRAGTFELTVSAGGERGRWRLPAVHVLTGFHGDKYSGLDGRSSRGGGVR